MAKKYLLDTNVCIFYMKGKYRLNEILTDKIKGRCYISEITVAELLYGASCSNNREEVRKQVQAFIEQFKIMPIFSSLQTFADIKAELRSAGNLIDDFDLLIGATAVHNNLVVVSENTKHLSHVPGVEIENWIDRSIN